MRAVVVAAMVMCGLLPGASAQPIYFSHFAGDPDSPGSADGSGGAARFHTPYAVATDAAGNVYVADGNETIRKITADGRVTTLAGLEGTGGSADGGGSSARFSFPAALAVDRAGNVYIADNGNHTVRKMTPFGLVTTLAGLAGSRGSIDGVGSSARFDSPCGIAVDASGNVFVSEWSNTIRKITLDGSVSTIAGRSGERGSGDGPGSAARFYLFPGGGITVDAAGNVIVADTGNSTIRRVTPDGLVTTVAGAAQLGGFADGLGTSARFETPWSVSADAAGNVYVADTYNFVVRKITPAGAVATVAGVPRQRGSNDGRFDVARFDEFWGVAADAAGNVYVADTNNNTVRRITSAGVVTTVVGKAGSSGSADGPGPAARFAFAAGVATDRVGNVYVTDNRNHTVRKITPAGLVTTLAGLAGSRGSTDGVGAAARFGLLTGIAVDADGNVFTVDWDFNTVRKITTDGVVTTLAGAPGQPGSVDGVGSAARFNSPFGVAADASGNLYVADTFNHTVRKVTPAGAVTTFAGVPGVPGSRDGNAAQALFSEPFGIAVDAFGNVFVSEFGNSTIRSISQSGYVQTSAGAAGVRGSTDGPGTRARFNQPCGIAVDAFGDLWIADTYNSTIRRYGGNGTVTTEGGLAGSFGNRDGTGGEARFERPSGVALDALGNLYVADAGNNAVRLGRRISRFEVLPDVATIDSATGRRGVERQLDTSPHTATTWEWSIVRQPAGSTATLSSNTIPNPRFTPDARDLYEFRLVATSGDRVRTSYVSLLVEPSSTTITRFVPIVLDVDNGSAHFSTELTLTNDTPSPIQVGMTYTPSLGSREGGGTVTDLLTAGEQRRIPDVLAYLRGKGLAIPSSLQQPSQGGVLRLMLTGAAAASDRVTALARTTADTGPPLPIGRAGGAYLAPLVDVAATSVTVTGLRSNATDRSNLAVVNLSDFPVTFDVEVRDADVFGRLVVVRRGETLPAWGWMQVNSAELLDASSVRNGYGLIQQRSEGAALYAYGVVNDRRTNDASFLEPFRFPSDPNDLFLPVAVELNGLSTELTMTNTGIRNAQLTVTYQESLSSQAGFHWSAAFDVPGFRQVIVPSFFDALRNNPGSSIGPPGGAYAGILRLTQFQFPMTALDYGVAVATARVTTADGFGLFIPCVRGNDAAGDRAAVYGLLSDATSRSNIALANVGAAGPVILRLQVHDGAGGGVPKGEALTILVESGEWKQINGILRTAGVTEGWVEITRTVGLSSWYAYGVINDGAFPGERTGDGSYVPMTK